MRQGDAYTDIETCRYTNADGYVYACTHVDVSAYVDTCPETWRNPEADSNSDAYVDASANMDACAYVDSYCYDASAAEGDGIRGHDIYRTPHFLAVSLTLCVLDL